MPSLSGEVAEGGGVGVGEVGRGRRRRLTCHLTFSGANDDVERWVLKCTPLSFSSAFASSDWTFKIHLKICHNWPFHCWKPFCFSFVHALALEIPHENIFQRIKCRSQMLLTYHNLSLKPFPYHSHSADPDFCICRLSVTFFFDSRPDN